VDFGLGLLGNTIEAARSAYRSLIRQPLFASEDRLHDDANTHDARIIGTDRFLATLKVSNYRPKGTESLEELALRICEERGASLQRVCSSPGSES
jgi:hypothetical protein